MKTDRFYRPELDVLRFLAFLIVFLVHRMDFLPIDPAEHFWLYNLSLLGDFGVPVFFLLSAFLITELLTREQDSVGSVHPGAFYMRRMLRIWPLYFAVFYGLVLLQRFQPGAGPQSPKSWLAFTFFAGNWFICRHGWIPAYPVDPLWSISVEEQFYLAIPVLALFGRRAGLKVISIILLVLSYVVVICYAHQGFIGFSSQWTNSFVQFQFFSAGVLLSVCLKGRVPRWHPLLRVAGVSACIACWFVASVYLGVQADTPSSTVVQAPLGWALVLLGTTMLFLSLLGMPEKYLFAPVVYLGRISYGLYLFHELVYYFICTVWGSWLARFSRVLHLSAWQGWLGTVAAFSITILISHLSYRFFESPFLRLKQRFTFVPSRD